MNAYKKITVQDIVNFINNNAALFPNGMKTPIFTGDFEGNYMHGKHEVQYIKNDGKIIAENCVVLSYEMHENVYQW